MVDMKAKPFYLTDEDCKWVEDTIAGMTVDEKIGQLFFNMGSSREEEYLKMTVRGYHIGGIRYNPATADESRTAFYRKTVRSRLLSHVIRRAAETAHVWMGRRSEGRQRSELREMQIMRIRWGIWRIRKRQLLGATCLSRR